MISFYPNQQIKSADLNANFTELKEKTDFLNTTPDDDWVTPTMQNSWVTYDSTYNTPQYRMDAMGYVYIKGMVKSGTIGQAIFTLPVGHRPIKRILMATISGSALGRVDIAENGEVIANTGSNAWFTIDNIIFKAEQ